MCLESIWQHTKTNYEVIVINNGSKDATNEYLHQVPCIKAIHNKTNLGFAQAVNQGICIAQGDYIIIINNDCVVSDEWEQRLVRAGEIEDVGVVGVMSNFVSYPQLLRLHIDSLNDIPHIAKQISEKYHESLIYTNRVVGLCMLIKKELTDKIGGLDPRFGLGTFEDDDFCLRSVLAGYKNVIAQDVFIYHFGSMTFKGKKNMKKNLMRENWQKFKEKWSLPLDLPLGQKDYLPYIDRDKFTIESLYVPFIN